MIIKLDEINKSR